MSDDVKRRVLAQLHRAATLLIAVEAYCRDNLDENMGDLVMSISSDLESVAELIEDDNEHTAVVIDGQLISENNNLKDLVRDMYAHTYFVDWGDLEPRIRKCLGVATRVAKSDD